MDQKLLTHCKEELIRQKSALINDACRTLNDQVHAQKEGIPDSVDRSLLETNRNFTLRLRDRERKLLKKIDEAIERIDNNTFGLCRGCGGYISNKRLKARPVATLCIDCKEEQEHDEKHGTN